MANRYHISDLARDAEGDIAELRRQMNDRIKRFVEEVEQYRTEQFADVDEENRLAALVSDLDFGPLLAPKDKPVTNDIPEIPAKLPIPRKRRRLRWKTEEEKEAEAERASANSANKEAAGDE